MSVTEPQPAMPKPAPSIRWYHLTPDRLVIALLVVEVLLWLSERFGWLPWHKGYAVLTAVTMVGMVMLLMLLWFLVALIFRWRFQFSIRSLLVLTVVVAIPSSWLGLEMKKAREQKRAGEAIRGRYDWEVDASTSSLTGQTNPPGQGWIRASLGDDFFDAVVVARPMDDAQMEYLKWLPGIRRLNFAPSQAIGGGMVPLEINNPHVTDAGLRHVRGLARLTSLCLSHNDVSDAGLQHIEGLTDLEFLYLAYTNVTDRGLKHLTRLRQLKELELYGAPIEDAGLVYLERLAHLRKLWLSCTQITDAGLVHVATLPALQDLRLDETQISDDGLQYLEQLPQLETLSLGDTKVTEAGLLRLKRLPKLRWLSVDTTAEGFKRLQRALPNCTIWPTPPTQDERQSPAKPDQAGG